MLIKKYLVVLAVAAAFLAMPLLALHNSYDRRYQAEILPQPTAAPDSAAIAVVPAVQLRQQPAPADQILTIPILMYHEISSGPDCMWVSDQDFRAQMQYLHDHGYQTLTLAQAAELLAGHYDTSHSVVLTFDDGYSTFYDHAWPVLHELGQTATLFVISGLVGNPEYVSWEQIKFLDAQGIEIGGHTITHPLLPSLAADRAAAEIAQDKQVIEAQLGHPITSFCYPTGRYNDSVIGQVQATGYKAAVTMVQREAASTDKLLLLPRWGVYQNDSLAEFTALID